MDDATATPSRPPLAVLVSGAPGAGKTTLARALAASLDLPVLHKDQLVHAVWRTRGHAVNLGAPGVEPFYRTMELWAELGISFVAEQTFYRGVSEPDVTRRVAPRCVLVNVHCHSRHAHQRFERRMREDPLCGEARLRALLPLAEQLQSALVEPLDFDCPQFMVDTDDGYVPALDDVVRQIDGIYSRPTIHDLDRPAPSS